MHRTRRPRQPQPPGQVYVAWSRQTATSPWVAVARCHDEAEAFREAMRETLTGDITVLPEGKQPIRRR